jgi:hypothetical protein
MRIGTFLIGSLVGAVAVMYFNRSSTNSAMGSNSLMRGNLMQRLMSMFSMSVPKSSSVPMNSNKINPSAVETVIHTTDSQHTHPVSTNMQ